MTATGRAIVGVRLTLAGVFLLMGAQKFTLYEATVIRPFVVHSPFLAWGYSLFGERGMSALLGVVEFAVGLGLCAGRELLRSRILILAAAGAVITTLITTSFLATTPGVLVFADSWPRLSLAVGQFFLKDAVLLAASCLTLADAVESGRHGSTAADGFRAQSDVGG
jgi:reactive chlorine resistance protein C